VAAEILFGVAVDVAPATFIGVALSGKRSEFGRGEVGESFPEKDPLVEVIRPH
jgi:hypothetical protein